MRPFPVPRRPTEAEDRLESWKEIASYLGREVRTVQGWEKNEGLPIHRHQHAKQGSVYAFRSELDAWREARKGVPETVSAITYEPEAKTEQAAAPGGKKRLWLLGIGAGVLALAGLAAVAWKATRPASGGNAVSSIVALPFLDLSPGKDQEYFSDGLTEEIIDALSRVPNLRVVARTSAFAFKGKAIDIREIGRQLNVDTVLEGSVRKAGDQLRITVQLNRASDGTHIWSRTYDRNIRDVFAVQREISQSVADQLKGAGQVPERIPTPDLEAYRLYQEGRYFFNQHIPPESYQKAIERYKQAIARDPNFALAYAAMSDAYAYLAENFAVAPREVMPKAKEAALKAVALNDRLAEGHTSLGIVMLDYEWDRDRAQREFRRAMQLNPGSGYVHHWYAHSVEAQGRLDDAMKEMRAALDLDPLSLPINWDIGSELLWAGRYDDTLRFLHKAQELFPNHPFILWEESDAYYDKGDLKSSLQSIEKIKATSPEMVKTPPMMALVAVADARSGRTAEARKTLDELERMRQTEYVEPFWVTHLCSALHDSNCMLTWCKRGIEERSTAFNYQQFFRKAVYAGFPEAERLLDAAR